MKLVFYIKMSGDKSCWSCDDIHFNDNDGGLLHYLYGIGYLARRSFYKIEITDDI